MLGSSVSICWKHCNHPFPSASSALTSQNAMKLTSKRKLHVERSEAHDLERKLHDAQVRLVRTHEGGRAQIAIYKAINELRAAIKAGTFNAEALKHARDRVAEMRSVYRRAHEDEDDLNRELAHTRDRLKGMRHWLRPVPPLAGMRYWLRPAPVPSPALEKSRQDTSGAVAVAASSETAQGMKRTRASPCQSPFLMSDDELHEYCDYMACRSDDEYDEIDYDDLSEYMHHPPDGSEE